MTAIMPCEVTVSVRVPKTLRAELDERHARPLGRGEQLGGAGVVRAPDR